MNQRSQRMANIVHRSVAEALIELLPGLYITIQKIDVSPDLRHATVWVNSLNAKENIVEAIKPYQQEIAERLGRVLATKFTPRLHFRLDWGAERAEQINDLLKEL